MWFGRALTSLFVPPLIDKYGRKLIVHTSFLVQTCTILGLLLTTDIETAFLLMFMLGACRTGTSSMSYIY
jgi:MFS family permease